MSKILYICLRFPNENPNLEKKIKSICDGFNPDNISPNKTFFHTTGKIFYGISNPTKTIYYKDSNVILGKLFGPSQNWEQPESGYPDGNYGLFRANEVKTEVISDVLGTRSIWYYFDDQIFISSTSQLGIIKYLGNFQFNNKTIPWVISTGSLGPDNSWDQRIKKVPANGSVLIDRKNWTLTIKETPVTFNPKFRSKTKQKEKLYDALKETFRAIKGITNWRITLSGGHDSRAILLLLKKFWSKENSELQTLTWGKKSSLHDSLGDAVIAQRVANKLKVKHAFFSTEQTSEDLNIIVNRFLNLGEGRIDHIAGYLDGFRIWKNLFENGVEGIIRGDEVFGYNKIYSPLIVNSFMGLTLCKDFSNLSKYDYIQGLEQEIPEYLLQKKNESIHTWRDRNFHQYRIPYIQSALADLKYAFVEQINPFLSKQIVNVVREIPDNLRTDKKLFKQIIKSLDVDIPYAKRDSNRLLKSIVKDVEMVSLIKNELSSPHAKKLFPESFLRQVIQNLTYETNISKVKTRSFSTLIKKALPINVKKFISQRKNTLILDENVLGFRLLIICRMHRMFAIVNENK